MSLFSWLTRKSKPQAQRADAAPGPLVAHDAAAAAPGRNGRTAPPSASAAAADQLRRSERTGRRELLYTAVRDAMVRAGVLSAGYKFKVLSLDQRGAQFLVMVDLAPEYGSDMERLTEIEALIAQSAKTRFDIVIPAIYWRSNPQIVVGNAVRLASTGTQPQPRVAEFTAAAAAASPVIVRPAPASQAAPAAATRPAPLVPPPAAPAPSVPAGHERDGRFDPIEADEMAAFKQALMSAAAHAPAVEPGVATRSGPLLAPTPVLTGFEDTVMPGQDGRGSGGSDLSSTQYGDLR
ncbi:hypothetical protein [Oryzisolibacter sp. LB2S]|uniref:hypothetical protein n=1 Tax=Alicycliphilus soli TaxID=3228789 RepID=UPI0034594994